MVLFQLYRFQRIYYIHPIVFYYCWYKLDVVNITMIFGLSIMMQKLPEEQKCHDLKFARLFQTSN